MSSFVYCSEEAGVIMGSVEGPPAQFQRAHSLVKEALTAGLWGLHSSDPSPTVGAGCMPSQDSGPAFSTDSWLSCMPGAISPGFPAAGTGTK